MNRTSAWQRAFEVTSGQWGMITRQQLANLGMSDKVIGRATAPGGIFARVAHGVYRLEGAPVVADEGLRAAWLQLAPNVLASKRTVEQGVVSHRSAANLYFFGDLPADVYEFTVRPSKQSRRNDVRVYRKDLAPGGCGRKYGLLVTKPARIVADLLGDYPDLEAIGRIATDALGAHQVTTDELIETISPHAIRLGFRSGDGKALLRAMLQSVDAANIPANGTTLASGYAIPMAVFMDASKGAELK